MWIKTVSEDEADGVLKRIYEDAHKRAGKVFSIVSSQSLRPRTLLSTLQAYADTVLRGSPGLSRAQREMLAVVTSVVNSCEY